MLTVGTRAIFSGAAVYSGVVRRPKTVEVTYKDLTEPETALEKSLAPRVFFLLKGMWKSSSQTKRQRRPPGRRRDTVSFLLLRF